VQAQPTTALAITLISPPSGSTVHAAIGGSVVVLLVKVTAPKVGTVGEPVMGAKVFFVVDGVVRCTTPTWLEGTAGCVLTVPVPMAGGVARSYQWYATASKPGYTPAKSATWTFLS